MRVLPLCPAHHRTGGYGVAVHGTGRAAWQAQYGTWDELLDRVDMRLRAREETVHAS